MYYKECPFCGCNLDPEEKCDCQDKKKKREERRAYQIASDQTARRATCVEGGGIDVKEL